MLDILARNAFLTHPNKVYGGGLRADRLAIAATDLFDPDLAELARTHLEEAEVPGVAGDPGQRHPDHRVPDHPARGARHPHRRRLRLAGSAELRRRGKKFTGEVGTWGGVRFVRTNRLVLRNHGAVANRPPSAADTVPGQGAAATVDTVYSVGQSNSIRYVIVADESRLRGRRLS